jgi:hypothetical protein
MIPNQLIMTDIPITLSEHMSRAAKARHAKRTPEERSEYGKKMVAAREEKRRLAKEASMAVPIIDQDGAVRGYLGDAP